MKKNILFINGNLNVGGCERSLVNVLQHFDYSKYNVDLLLLQEKGDYLSEVPQEVNIILYSLNDAYGKFFDVFKKAIKRRDWFSLIFRMIYFYASKNGNKHLKKSRRLFIKLRSEYDTIIAYRPGICTDMAAYAFRSNNKISWWHHGEMNLSANEICKLNDSYQYMNCVVTVSESSRKLVRDTFPEVINKIHVIPNMICPHELVQKSNLKIESLKFDNEISIVSVGRMSSEKNMMLCPKVGLELETRGIHYRWYMIGDGEDYQEIKEFIDANNLQNDFVLTGSLTNPYPFIKEADIMVHPSLVESQGITVLESMALGTPVIAVKSEGPKEFIKNRENGLLVEADSESIVEAILLFCESNSLMERCKNGAIKTVEEYSDEKIISQIEALI